MENGGVVYIISAPSGSGKTTIAKRLIKQRNNLSACVSHTTRPPRAGERHSVDYYFVDRKEFLKMVSRGQFVECAKIYNYYYGSSFNSVNKSLAHGNALLEVDWQGARQIRKKFAKTTSILILPPSLAELKRRLFRRNLDKPDIMEKRLQSALQEASHWQEFDHVVVNENINVSCLEIERLMQNKPQGSYGKRLAKRTLVSLRLLTPEP